MNRLTGFISGIFGYLLLLLSVLVTIETIGRKWLNFSLQGVDEMGGYALAITTGLAFTVALVDRAHIRIDLVYERCNKSLKTILDWISLLSILGMAALLLYVAVITFQETVDFKSTAPTPLATPLIWPQGLWLATLVIFFIVALLSAARATTLILRRRSDTLRRDYGVKIVSDELEEELDSFEQRLTHE